MIRRITIRHDYLRIPVKLDDAERTLCIRLGGEKKYQFEAPFYTGEDAAWDFVGELPVREFKGQEIEVEVSDCADVPLLCQGNGLLPRTAAELHPYLHFTPKAGWLNDPNGLCIYQGEYHLFFQHNPFDVKWNNISWGHAVSRDLLHWRQVEEALLPDERGAMFSGSAIEENGELLLYYTHAGGRTEWSRGKHFTQDIARSRDGRNFTKDRQPVLPWMVFENRDPKVGRSPDGSRYMALFLDGHDYGIFRSKDGRNWEQTQTLTIPDRWECPDLVELPVRDRAERRWMFWTAEGYYLIGDFDGRTFTPTQEIRKLYGNRDGEERRAYAAQTFCGIPGRVVQLAWMKRLRREGLYQGGMSLPRELELIPDGEGYGLAAHPVREMAEQCRPLWKAASDEENPSFVWNEEGAAVLFVDNAENASFLLRFCGARIAWDAGGGTLSVDGLSPAQLPALTDLTLIADKGVLEIGCLGDTVCFFADLAMDFEKELRMEGKAGLLLELLPA